VKDFLVPDLGEGLQDATLSAWSVAVDDVVELNQPLCTLETAKAEVEIPSPYAGRIVELGGGAGHVLPVGSLLVRIDTDTAKTNGAVRTPVLVGYGADADFDTGRRARAKPPVAEPQERAVEPGRRARAKPPVRKLAAELEVDIDELVPGRDGLISREAVLAAAGADDIADNSGRPAPSYDVIPVQGVHAEMAKRMVLSRSVIPDAHAGVEVDGTRLLELRSKLGVTAFALTMRFLVLALTHHRILNSTWVEGPDGTQVHSHHAVHLGVAVASPRGLLVPVVRDAQSKTTRELTDVLSRLIEQGRAGTLLPADMHGSTFTVSNFGALGLDEGVPVINYPESAILGIGALRPRAVVAEGAVTVRSTMMITCAFDHRVADGAQVAEFLCALRGLIEAPETALADL
jgi:2-oxoisovalerate dehydrogenase E2 component (dihydrolipoyl transacylase)